jgi:putative tryptophan/tyrosine transport system substrate-binding protein
MRRRATSSLPGLTRQSILLRKKMDARVKPAHDGAKILCRREFILALGGAAAPSLFWPLAARAQQSGPMPLIGYFSSQLQEYDGPRLEALRRGLSEAGYVEGANVAIEYRWAEGDYDRLAAQAAEFVRRRVAVIFAASLPSALAAKAATTTIPIVFVMGADPVKLGVVASLNQPGGNVTGVTQFYGALGGKRLELIRELVPKASLIAVLTNPKNPNSEDHLADVRAAAQAMGQRILVFPVSADGDVEPAFASIAQQGADALLVADDPFFSTRRDQLVAQAARRALPAIYYTREFPTDGGLISYGSNAIANYGRAGAYVARILKGTAPADLPVEQPTKFELVINLKTAKTLGLTVPLTLQAAADEVIE